MSNLRNNPDSPENQAATQQHKREVFALQMQHRNMPIHTTSCPNCEREIEIEVEPYIPARTYGDPNDCYPAEGGTIEPSKCPYCDFKLSQNEIYKEWADNHRDHIADYAEGAD